MKEKSLTFAFNPDDQNGTLQPIDAQEYLLVGWNPQGIVRREAEVRAWVRD